MITKKNCYKLYPPKIKPRKESDFYFYSPEQFKLKNFRNAIDKHEVDLKKSDIFAVGMIVLKLALLENLQNLYGKFEFKENELK